MDYIARKSNLMRNFDVDFRSRAEWKTCGVLQGTQYFSLKYQRWSGAVAGVFSNTHSVVESYCLLRFHNIFCGGTGDTGSLSIAEARSEAIRYIAILTDGQTTIKTVYSVALSLLLAVPRSAQSVSKGDS